MKLTKTILSLTLICSGIYALAQQPYSGTLRKTEKKTEIQEVVKDYGPPRQNIIKMNFLSPVVNTLMLFYQHNVDKYNSFQVGVGYMNYDGFLGTASGVSDPNTLAYFVTPEYRYLLSGENMRGTFIAPFLKYTNMTYTATYSDDNYYYGYPPQPSPPPVTYQFNYQSLGLGVCIGQQFIYRNKISIEIFAGPVFNMLLAKTYPVINPSFQSGIGPQKDIELDNVISRFNISGYGIRAGFTVGFLL